MPDAVIDTKTWLARSESWRAMAVVLIAAVPQFFPGAHSLPMWLSLAVAIVMAIINRFLNSNLVTDRPSWKTPAFWVSAASILASGVAAITDFQMPGLPEGVTKVAAMLLALLTAGGYQAIRYNAKTTTLPPVPRSGALPSILLIALLTGASLQPSCATVVPLLPTVLAYVQDAALVISTIESFVQAYYAANPNPAKLAEIESVIAKAKSALAAGKSAVNGVQNLNQAQVDLAFADFKAVYTDLLALTGPIGVHEGIKTEYRAMPSGAPILVVPPVSALLPRTVAASAPKAPSAQGRALAVAGGGWQSSSSSSF